MTYTEDQLAQKTLADYLENELGWQSVCAHNSEKLGADGTLGRRDEGEAVLTRYLGEALENLNPGLPEEAYEQAIFKLTEETGFQSIPQINRAKYALMRDGVPVTYRNAQGEEETRRLRVFDFNDPENNYFLCARELWMRGDVYRKRPDVIGFVNGLPLLFVECKRPDKSLRRAYDGNIADYRDTIPQVFYHNAIVMLANGIEAKIGSITAKYEHFNHWKRLSEGDKGVVEMETLVKGVCDKRAFLDIVENFILFDDSAGETAKILARNHQYLGVNAAFEAVQEREKNKGKLGVFWHTQGAGKSYSMAFFAQKVRRKLGGDFTFLTLTDRQDLDNQIYKTFAGVGLANNDKEPCRAESGAGLRAMLSQNKAFVFALIQKFNQQIKPGGEYSTRSKIIVMSDEAHRTQYGTLAQNMRDALPNAAFIGFTGTPLFKDDEITSRVFGDYVSVYNFHRAVEDNATLPLYYDARGEKLGINNEGLNERLAEAIAEAEAELEDPDVAAKLESELKREYHVVTAPERLQHIAEDFAAHCATNWEAGKAMFVAIDKITAVKMHGRIVAEWEKRIAALERELASAQDEQEETLRKRQIAWMQETKIAVVISEEQGEVDKFRKWGLDILPHRKIIRDGFALADSGRLDVDTAFKRDDHPFRVVIVCAMWLTGFDVPALSTLYLDKPMQKHTLMQAIARANRVKEGKNNGLIVDYCGILRNLRQALATFVGGGEEGGGAGGTGGGGKDPLRPEKELIAELKEAIKITRDQLLENGFELDRLINATGFAKNKALADAKEAVNTNDETRKRFEISARNVFVKYKACLTFESVKPFRAEYEAIGFIYKMLREDRENADTTAIIKKLNEIVGKAIYTRPNAEGDDRIFDISKINFDALREEFQKSERKRSDIQAMKSVIEERLAKMLAENPLRTDFQARYDEIIADYNSGQDRNAIEAAFEALMLLTADMEEEKRRHIKEGLENEQQLAVFDMLIKPDLQKEDIKKIKKVSVALLASLLSHLEQVQAPFATHSASAEFRMKIYNFLYDENTGLPESAYNDADFERLTDKIYKYFKRETAAA